MEHEKPTVTNTLSLMELYRDNPELPSTPEEVRALTKGHPSDEYVEMAFPRCIEIDEETGDKYMVTALWEDFDFMWIIKMVPVNDSHQISPSCVIAKLKK